MSAYGLLTNRQKEMIKSLKDEATNELRQGVSTRWGILTGGGGGKVTSVGGIGNLNNVWHEKFGGATVADFDVFEVCGFLIKTADKRYSLVEQAVLNAITSDFGRTR